MTALYTAFGHRYIILRNIMRQRVIFNSENIANGTESLARDMCDQDCRERMNARNVCYTAAKFIPRYGRLLSRRLLPREYCPDENGAARDEGREESGRENTRGIRWEIPRPFRPRGKRTTRARILESLGRNAMKWRERLFTKILST